MAGGDAARPPTGAAGGGEDPLSADRRTLTIAAIAMVVLIAVGVVSAALFTQSACGLATPDSVSADAVGDDVTSVLAETFDDLDAAAADELVAELGVLAGDTPSDWPGTPGAAADVGQADALTTVDDALVATGERVSVLPGPDGGGQPLAAEVEDPAVVVGSGETLFSLAEVHPPTGQVSAIVPVGTDLEPGDCYDSAQVGVQLAFRLDAEDGQLLLFRSDDDGDLPELELRAADGSVWSQRIEVGAGPPGALAARLSGLLDDDLVLTARRAHAHEEPPAVQARDREDGEVQWSVAPSEVAERMPPGDEAVETRVVGATEDLVVLAAGREEQEPVLLLALDRTDGDWRWISDLDARAVPDWVGEVGGELQVLVPQRAAGEEEIAGHELVALDPEDGSATTLHGLDGSHARAASTEEAVLFTVDGSLVAVDGDGPARAAELPVGVADVASVGDATAVLLRDGDEAAVVWLVP